MTSYRASGGGGLLRKAGIDPDRIEDRVVKKYPEIRELLYRYLQEEGTISPEKTNVHSLIGPWEFIPSETAGQMIAVDMEFLGRK